MAITFVGAGTVQAGTATTSTVTGTLPVSPNNAAIGDVLLWVIAGQVAYAGSTPTGWNSFVPTVNGGTTASLTVFSRVVDGTESASYSTSTANNGKWVSFVVAYRGVDTTTPQDASFTTGTAGAQPAITTATPNARVLAIGRATTASGVTGTTWTSSSGTVRASGTDNISAATNTTAALADQLQASAGAVTPNLNPSGTNTQGLRVTVALRLFVPVNTGTASGSTTFSGTASGAESPVGAASGTSVHTGTAAGSRAPVGAATGSTAHTGAASGTVTRSGTGTGATTHVGTASGARLGVGSASGATVRTSSASGQRKPKASSTGTVAYVGSATGVVDRVGTGSGATAWAGVAAGAVVRAGTATGATTWVGLARGQVTTPAVRTLAVSAEARRLVVSFDDRVERVPAESRTLTA